MIDFNYYKIIHLGCRVDNELTFKRLLARSMKALNLYTMNRIKNIKDEEILELVRVTLCELIDLEAEYEEIKSMGEIKSITQGKRAVSYYTPEEMGVKNAENKKYKVVRENLLYTGLLTRSSMRYE